jgi:hypothetical protein
VSLDKIIAEIDEYLARLEMARDLLAGANRTVTHRTVATKQHRSRAMQPETALRSRGTRRQPSKRPRTGRRAHTNEGAFTESFCVPGSSAPNATPTTKQLSLPAQVQALIPITSVGQPLAERLPRPNASQRRTRRRVAVVKPLTDRPAIARSESSSSRIVVISPEEARRAREHAAQATPKPRFTRIIPSSGRQAFEALFGSEADL